MSFNKFIVVKSPVKILKKIHHPKVSSCPFVSQVIVLLLLIVSTIIKCVLYSLLSLLDALDFILPLGTAL